MIHWLQWRALSKLTNEFNILSKMEKGLWGNIFYSLSIEKENQIILKALMAIHAVFFGSLTSENEIRKAKNMTKTYKIR